MRCNLASHTPVRVEGNENDWMAQHVMLNVPNWLEVKRQPFKYNKIFSFWRSNYIGHLRQKLRDFDLLRQYLPLPARHSLAICSQQIYIRHDDGNPKQPPCEYERLIRAVPMDSPIEPEAIWEMIKEHSKTSFIGCSFGHVAKSHVLRSTNFEGLTTLRAVLDEQFGHQGYSTSMLVRSTTRDPEYMVSITHTSERFSDFLLAIALDGFKSCSGEDFALKEPAPLTQDEELALQEASLLQQLNEVRARRRALHEDDPHQREM